MDTPQRAASPLADPVLPASHPGREWIIPLPATSVEQDGPPADPSDAVDPSPVGDAETGDGAGAERAGTGELDERDQRILAFERRWWRHAGSKEQAVRDEFGLSATRYYQLLNRLIDDPAALAAEPVLVQRLRRLRASRSRARRATGGHEQ